MNFFLGFVVGVFFWAFVRSGSKKPEISIPRDSVLSLALFDDQGNQLTDRALVSIGVDGFNARPIVAHVLRSGPVHHGVIYLGEYGSVVETDGDSHVAEGDEYIILPGDWKTELT